MKLSVIIPIYNVQDYLAVCLDSVIVPGLPDYEIVAVNDGRPTAPARSSRITPRVIRTSSGP